jgi:hypothetical protein
MEIEQSSKARRIARPLDPLAYVAGYGSGRSLSEFPPNTVEEMDSNLEGSQSSGRAVGYPEM